MIGGGFSVNEAISKMSMVVEGYYATKNAFEISKNNKESFYIIDTVFDILYNNKNPKEKISSLSKKLD
jgi:Glycerol-3-phosphate dehydrogenase